MSEQKLSTKAIRTQIERTQYMEHSNPLFLTSSFVFEDSEEMRASFAEEKERNIYSRFTNPNNSELVQKMCKLEGAEDGYAFATGMSAIFSTFAALLNAGDHILSFRAVFGSTHTLFTKFFPKWKIKTTYFDSVDLNQIGKLIRPTTKIIYVESPTNPGLQVLDLEKLGRIAKQKKVIFIVDNCFSTPYLQQPIKFGADLVIHSATKLIDGQGRVMGGITVGKSELIREIYLFARNSGPALSPFNAWILSKSLETLAVRLDKHCDNAEKVIKFLDKHIHINEVRYPFSKKHPQYKIAKKQMKRGGNIIAFEVKGGLGVGQQFVNNIKLCSLSANLGDTRTIITQPAFSTHSKLSHKERKAVQISDNLIRISVGLEDMDDIINDIDQALNNVNYH
jgi:O-succinylhomoserine sulfhydrylase|tara:strand:- start:60 stop:1241 length:1182 start_codon:yes stop_codon:yes gene_type:complete